MLRHINRLSFLTQPVFLFYFSILAFFQVTPADILKAPIMFFDICVFCLFLWKQLGSVLLESPINVLHAFNQDIELNVFRLDQFLSHLQANI